jgi:hypothetical protein
MFRVPGMVDFNERLVRKEMTGEAVGNPKVKTIKNRARLFIEPLR